MLLYYITDRKQFPGSETERCKQLLDKVREAVAAGVDYIQLRERDLNARQLEDLGGEVADAVGRNVGKTRLLVNSRTDVALAIAADGVNLRSKDLSPGDVRRIWRSAGSAADPVVAVSCHSEKEVQTAKLAGADFVVFGPVFGKDGTSGSGVMALQQVCAHGIAVLALGGVTTENAKSCVAHGASGIAGIRLFQQGEIGKIVRGLRP